MQTNSSIEPPDSGNPCAGGNRESGPFARLLSVVRGDKYMVDAYEPAWSALMMERRVGARVLPQDDGGEPAAAARSAGEPRPIGAGHVAPAASRPKER
jgi:hypothetical protein